MLKCYVPIMDQGCPFLKKGVPFCIANSYYLRYNERKEVMSAGGGEVFEENKKDNFLGLDMYIFDYYEWTGSCFVQCNSGIFP